MILLVHCGKLDTAQHEKIRSAIDSDPRITDWRHVLESSWLVETRDHNTSALRDMIREESGGCSVIVIPVSTYTGYLDKAVWEWLEKKDLSDAPKPPQNKPQAAEDNDAVRGLREITDAPDIDSFIGMDDAVAQLRRQIGGIAFRRNAGDIGLKLKQGFSNMLLMGPPGVGKTSLALCAAMMLKDNLPGGSKKRVFLVQAADLIDRHVGKSTNNTKAVLQAAGDGVIVFDEIDTLMDVAHYGEEVLNTLNTHIGNAPNHPVIVATIYGKREHEFRSANPGLSSRLPHTQRLPSYDDKTLTAIFMRLAADAGLTVTPQAETAVTGLLAAQRRALGTNFGHAREVDNIFEAVVDAIGTRYLMLDDESRAALIDDPESVDAEQMRTVLPADIPMRDPETGALTPRRDVIAPPAHKEAPLIVLKPRDGEPAPG